MKTSDGHRTTVDQTNRRDMYSDLDGYCAGLSADRRERRSDSCGHAHVLYTGMGTRR